MAELNTDQFYRLFELNGDKFMRVQDMNGYKITEIKGTSTLNAIDQFKAMSDLISAYVKLRIFGAKTEAGTQERSAHTYLVRFDATAATSGLPVAGSVVNGVGFSEVIALMKENAAERAALQNTIGELKMKSFQDQINELKNKKPEKSDMQELIGAAKEILPLIKMANAPAAAAGAGIGNNGTAKMTMEGANTAVTPEQVQAFQVQLAMLDKKISINNATVLLTLVNTYPEPIINFMALLQQRPAEMLKLMNELTTKPQLVDTLMALIPNS